MKSARINNAVARTIAFIFLLIFAACSTGLATQSGMPFNGKIAFHKTSLTIPSNYVRDSTQSTEDFWIFEKGFYSKCIMLSRKDAQGEAKEQLGNYAEYLKSQGIDSQRTTFLQLEAVYSESLQEEMPWREMLFAHDGSLYAVAMRGGTAEEMQILLDTVAVHDEAPEITIPPDNRTPLNRFFGYFFGK